MAEERATVMERLSGAMVSDDLSVVTDKRGDVDHLAALGAVMQRRSAGVSAMLRLAVTGDTNALRDVLRFATGVTRRLSIKRGWNLHLKDIKHVAQKAVGYHFSPVCPACNGRKFKTIKGSPSLSASPCAHCHGTGQRPYPIRYGKEIATVVWSMEDQFRVIESEVRWKL